MWGCDLLHAAAISLKAVKKKKIFEHCASDYNYLMIHWLFYASVKWCFSLIEYGNMMCFPLQKSCPSAYLCPTARSRRMWWVGRLSPLRPVAQFPCMHVCAIKASVVVKSKGCILPFLYRKPPVEACTNEEAADSFFGWRDICFSSTSVVSES